MNPEAVVAEIEEIQAPLLKWLGVNQVIASEEQQKNAEDMLIHARQAIRSIETKRKELLEPVNETRDRINALFKPLTDRLTLAIAFTNQGLQAYHTEQVRLAKEAQELLLAEQAEKLKEAEVTGEVVELLRAEVMPQAPGLTHRANLGSVTYREEPKITIVNPSLVPRALCEPSLPKIRAKVKSGAKKIPGVLITMEYVTVARAGK